MHYELRYAHGTCAMLFTRRRWWHRWKRHGVVDITAILELCGTKPFTLRLK